MVTLLFLVACASTDTDTRECSRYQVDGGNDFTISPNATKAAAADRDFLAPLTGEEITMVRQTLMRSGKLECKHCRLPYIALHEPGKGDLKHDPQRQVRAADVMIADLDGTAVFSAVVDVTRGTVAHWKNETEALAPWSDSESEAVVEALRSDRSWLTALRGRGIQSLEDVIEIPILAGDQLPDSRRRVRVIAYAQMGSTNAFLAPIEGLMAVVDVAHRHVIHVYDRGDAPRRDYATIPRRANRFALTRSCDAGPQRFTIHDREITWHDWRFKIGMNVREGLVLYSVTYGGADTAHSILARASLAEMFVPYGSPDSSWYFRAAFDEGEYMLGRLVTTLQPGLDAPANARFASMVLPDDQGAPRTRSRVAAVFERDAGVLRRHGNFVEPARELVVHSVYTIGNYDYGINWIFDDAGAIRIDVELSGVMFVQEQSGAVVRTDDLLHGHLVADHQMGVHHQHFFNFRLDFDLAGRQNTVVEMNARADNPGVRNAYGNGFVVEHQMLGLTGPEARDVAPGASRSWLVENTTVTNALGTPEAYEIVPGASAVPYVDSESQLGRRAAFAYHQLWVTQYAADQRFPAGDFPVRVGGPNGILQWTNEQRPIRNTDLVVWYTLGVTHLPRPEDWPVMPTVHISFLLRPYGMRDPGATSNAANKSAP